MKTNDQGSREDQGSGPIEAASPRSRIGAGMAISADELASFLVQVTREVWRLESAVEKSKTRGELVSDEIAATLDRLREELESLGLQASDPVGQTYEPGQRVEIAHLEPGGSGELLIKRTVLPGVILNGTMLKPASVIVGRKDT
jgi:molecular chaperone GrpE (heat shock protein)